MTASAEGPAPESAAPELEIAPESVADALLARRVVLARRVLLGSLVGLAAVAAWLLIDDGMSVNVLEVQVGESETQFVINGTVVHTAPNSGMAGRTDGVWGVRVNHRIPGVLVEGLGVSN